MSVKVEEDLKIELEKNGGWDPRVRSIKCGDLVRSYLIKTERFLLIYDTLLGPKSGAFLREQALQFADGRPLLVVNSHADWDHYFGNMMFPEPILGSQLMIDRLREGVGDKELQKKRAAHPLHYQDVALLFPSVGLSGPTTLQGGDLTLEILVTPGHRPDHLALYIPEINTLFPGDCVEDPIPLVDEDSTEASQTLRELTESLESMLALKAQWVLANHASPEPGSSQLEANLQYLKRLAKDSREARDLEDLQSRSPIDPRWDSFYQSAHLSQLRMAWEQSSCSLRT